MNDFDYDKLIEIAQKSCKRTFQTRLLNGKLMPNVANLGGHIGDIAKLERSGEYYGIAVEIMENLKPLLTNHFIIKILHMLKREDYVTPLELLKLVNLDQLQYILAMWFRKATNSYEIPIPSKKYPIFDTWINTVAHDPIMGRIKIIEIGHNQNTGNSVVPNDWLDREFANANELHQAMNHLETRIGKPPVTFAVIYSMIIQKKETMVNTIKNLDYENIFYLDFDGIKFDSIHNNVAKKGYNYVSYGKTIIGFKLDDILQPKDNTNHDKSKLRQVGVLVSRLQKAIRRGRCGSKALIETIEALNVSPNYNLPEQNFLRVSASKQMVWRLFISILEDCRPYQPIDEPSLLDLILLVLITQKVQEYKFTDPVLRVIKMVALLAQYNDNTIDLYPWRNLPVATKTPLKPGSDYHNAISLALEYNIMMAGDTKMLCHYYSEDNVLEPFFYPKEFLDKTWYKKKYIYHDQKIYDDIILSSYDMHCKPQIILYYQACIPVTLTTKQISNYIWDKSSSYNVRSGKKKPKADPILRSIQEYFFKGLEDDIQSPINVTMKSY